MSIRKCNRLNVGCLWIAGIDRINCLQYRDSDIPATQGRIVV
jgi:hypothetical protein